MGITETLARRFGYERRNPLFVRDPEGMTALRNDIPGGGSVESLSDARVVYDGNPVQIEQGELTPLTTSPPLDEEFRFGQEVEGYREQQFQRRISFHPTDSTVPSETRAFARNAVAPVLVVVGYPLAYFAEGGIPGEVGAGLAGLGTLLLGQKAGRAIRRKMQQRVEYKREFHQWRNVQSGTQSPR
jgi:hypothetical protein